MNKDWEKIDQLFHQALECPDEGREEFLARVAQSDPTLGGELQALLNVHEENHSFLETPAMRVDLSPQFGRWQAQIVETMDPPSSHKMVGHKMVGQMVGQRTEWVTGQMIGRLLDGKYRLDELCGRGGMGAVYRALHMGTGRRVAVKVIAPELAGNPEFIERFRREARTIGRLRHPNIVNVTDFGITGENEQTLAYLVMEHLEGGTLADRLKDKRPLPLADALDILNQTCAAIDEAHRQGVLHRDLKPENIWLEPVGFGGCNVKVLDFGIAQLHDLFAIEEPEPLPDNSETSRADSPQLQSFPATPFSITEDETLRLNLTLRQLTRAGAVLGTPKYMSPEQCRGEKLDKASDIYSLGVIAYQMLTGETPFNGTVAELLQQHREAAPAPLSQKRWNLPVALDAVVCQALAKDPSVRPATAGAFAFLLSLQTTGNDWLRQQADAIYRRHRFKLTALAVRLQWPNWLLTGLVLMATVKLPGLSPLQTGLVFGFLWLLIAAVTLWKQNSTTAACALFLEQARNPAKQKIDTGDIISAIRRRSGALARATWAELAGLARKLGSFKLAEIKRWADSLLIAPPLTQEGLGVDEATQRSARLIAPLRRKLAYPFFRRLLAFTLVLTAWQVMLAIWGATLDGGRSELPRAIIIMPPLMLALCFTAFSLGLKSSLEQAVLYFTARQALGEISAETAGMSLRQDAETKPSRWWPYFKTYAPTCAMLLLMGALQFLKFPLMSAAINSREIYTVKALQAAGVPLPFWSLSGAPPTGYRRWIRRAMFPFGRHRFQPYDLHIIQSAAMTKFLLEKGVDVNRRLTVDGRWTPPGVGAVTMTPLQLALTDAREETARLMIAHGADVHARDSIGRSPLTVAITYCPSAIEMLLASGADINEQTRFGAPLLVAARYQWLYTGAQRMRERENAVKILLEKGADPNTRDADGRNALMVMSMELRTDGDNLGIKPRRKIPPPPSRPGSAGKREVAGLERQIIAIDQRLRNGAESDRALLLIGEALLKAGCDINAADGNGRTPLMYAARYNRPAAVLLLLQGGADINAKDKSGMTALDLAKQVGNQDVIRLLQLTGVQSVAAKK
jgi:serine/threonine protein kinase/ankyrin repeat protein